MNPIELEINNHTIRAEIIEQKDHFLKVSINDVVYDLDVMKVENGIYSLLYNGKSIEMQISNGEKRNKYQVQHDRQVWDIQIVDAETRYMRNRNKGTLTNGMNHIFSPMPGKVVNIPVSVGDRVEEGQTVIIISAMKMESEYKSPRKGMIKKILTEEGAKIEGNQPLIILE